MSSNGGPRVNQLDRVKQEYTQAARGILQRSMRGVARTKLTPDMLTLAGVALCLAGAVLVGFAGRNEYLFFWLGDNIYGDTLDPDILAEEYRAQRAGLVRESPALRAMLSEILHAGLPGTRATLDGTDNGQDLPPKGRRP